jgi:hypothetical protein
VHDGCPLLSFLSFFPFVSPEASIHSFLLQASLELTPQHDDDASRFASPRHAITGLQSKLSS